MTEDIKTEISTNCSYYKDVVKNEILIDGVNVAGCDFFAKEDLYNSYSGETQAYKGECGCSDDTMCKDIKNCCYKKQGKQLKHLEQENKKLKKDVQLFKCLDTFGESECHCACRCLGNEFCEDAEIKINKYKTALEEIREINKLFFERKYGYPEDLIEIDNIINEVLND